MHTKRVFSKFGIPKEVISDNGPQYISREYSKFAREWDFKHDSSSPEYPQSNGFIERTIQTVKKTLKKAFHSGDDPYLALLALRTTPFPNGQPAPATILMNRQLRTTLPAVNNKIRQKGATNATKVPQKSSNKPQNRTLQPLEAGDFVRFRRKNAWDRKGVIVEKCKQPRSYKIATDKGTTVRRNRKHLLHTKEDLKPMEHFMELSDSEPDDPQHLPPQAVAPEASPADQRVQLEQRNLNLQHPRVTRSGRAVQRPRHLEDFTDL